MEYSRTPVKNIDSVGNYDFELGEGKHLKQLSQKHITTQLFFLNLSYLCIERNNYMKTILSISNSANKWKSKTLKELATLLTETYPTLKTIVEMAIGSKGDFRLIININGIIIGIESEGDPNTDLEKRIFDLSDNFQCDIIICTSRTRGETTQAINKFTRIRGYQAIWTSTYQISDSNQHALVNRLKAKHILELFQSLNLL